MGHFNLILKKTDNGVWCTSAYRGWIKLLKYGPFLDYSTAHIRQVVNLVIMMCLYNKLFVISILSTLCCTFKKSKQKLRASNKQTFCYSSVLSTEFLYTEPSFVTHISYNRHLLHTFAAYYYAYPLDHTGLCCYRSFIIYTNNLCSSSTASLRTAFYHS